MEYCSIINDLPVNIKKIIIYKKIYKIHLKKKTQPTNQNQVSPYIFFLLEKQFHSYVHHNREEQTIATSVLCLF